MADLAASDVTYTSNARKHAPVGMGRSNFVTVAFGDAALTYPAGGVPLTKASLGCPTVVNEIYIEDSSATRVLWSVDKTNLKLRGYFTTGGATASPASEADPKSTSGASTASAVDATTPNITPGRMKELASGSTAPAATTLKLVVVGY